MTADSALDTTQAHPLDATVTAPVAARRSRWRPASSWRERTNWLPLDTVAGQVLRGMRWAAIVSFVVVAVWYGHTDGIPFDREGLLLWIAVGLAACCIGRHPVWLLWVAVDFLPLAFVLVAYDYLRGLSDRIGMPTWWHPQIDVDRWLFFGHEPTLWLQERLKGARFTGTHWYDVVVTISYYSFFFLPYVTAGVLWLRSRVDFYRWTLRFVGLSFLGFTLFVLIPAAPPWAAALCTPADVADHPNSPSCMNAPGHVVPGNLLGHFTTAQPGANPYVERIAGDSFYKLHLGVAHGLWTKGFSVADAVAAVPSLHLGGTVLFCLFMWPRVAKWWRPILVGYPLVMMFSLVYAGEHYVADGIAGALCAWLVNSVANRIERRRRRRAQARLADNGPTDTLEPPPDHHPGDKCRPPLHATTPSST